MRKFIKTASLVFYFLSFLIFFFLGLIFAGITNAAEGQGLAGGAIVLGYGIIFGFIALLFALLAVYVLPIKSVIKFNWFLFLLLLLIISGLVIRQTIRKNKKSKVDNQTYLPAQPNFYTVSNVVINADVSKNVQQPGIGFFIPDFMKLPVIHFYDNPNTFTSQLAPIPYDSLVFKKSSYSYYEIVYAPPWLQPEHLKLDYDMIFFKVNGVGTNYAEIIVNKSTQQKAYVSRLEGHVIYWPDFLLMTHSVEMLPGAVQKIRIKPLNYAGEVNVSFEFLKPVFVKDEWILVELQDKNFKLVGSGWLQWKIENRILISYALLS